jgi:hypothetical protein
LVIGDANAEWLAYRLEDAFSEKSEIGIVRKHRSDSGLIRYDAHRDTAWLQVVREIITAEKPKFIVMMIGNNDRETIREKAPPPPPRGAPKVSAAGTAGPVGHPDGPAGAAGCSRRPNLKVLEQRKVTVKKKDKTRTVMKSFTKLVDEDFTWKDPKAAEKAGMSLMEYVIGGMDRSFKLKLYHALRALDDAGLSPGFCCKKILLIRARKIDSRSDGPCATLVQKSIRPDSELSSCPNVGSGCSLP